MSNNPNAQRIIGRAVVRCLAVQGDKVQLEFVRVQANRGLREIRNRQFTFENPFPYTIPRIAEYGGFTFERTGQRVEMKPDKEYIVVVNLRDDQPHIVCMADKEKFEALEQEIESEKSFHFGNSTPFRHMRGDTFNAQKKKKPKKREGKKDPVYVGRKNSRPLERPEDGHSYSVHLENGKEYHGTLTHIVSAAARELLEDPAQILASGIWRVWEVSGAHAKCPCPTLPPLNRMLLASLKKISLPKSA